MLSLKAKLGKGIKKKVADMVMDAQGYIASIF